MIKVLFVFLSSVSTLPKTDMKTRMMVSSRILLFQGSIFSFYVSFAGVIVSLGDDPILTHWVAQPATG